MTEILRITAAQPVIFGVLKLVWNDGYEGVVDLRGSIAKDEFSSISEIPTTSERSACRSLGHSIYWGDENDAEVDFGCDHLRDIAEVQAAVLAHEQI